MGAPEEIPTEKLAAMVATLEARVEELKGERDRALATQQALVREVLPLAQPSSPVASPARQLILAAILFLLGATAVMLWLQHNRLNEAAQGGVLLEQKGLPERLKERAPRRTCLGASPSRTSILTISELDPLGPLALSPDGRHIALAGGDGAAGLYDLCTDRMIHRLFGHRGVVRAIAFSRDGLYLFTGGEDGVVAQWDRQSGKRLRTLRRAGAPIRGLAVGPREVAVAAEESQVTLYPVNGRTPRQLHAHSGWVRTVAMDRSGRSLASGGDDLTIRIWDVQKGVVAKDLTGHSLWINALTFSPDGRQLASAALDNRLLLWDLTTGAVLHRWRGHVREISDLSFNEAGTLLASASLDRSVAVWDVAKGIKRHHLTGHRWKVNAVVFGQHDRLLVTSSGDGTVRIWPIPPAMAPSMAPLSRPGPGELTFRNNTTGERLRLRVLDPQQKIIPAAHWQLARFLRSGPDDRTGPLAPELIALLFKVSEHFGRHQEIMIVSGYRSLPYNEIRTKQSKQVARESQHLKGTAIDFRIEGVTITALHQHVKSLRAGGVGFYADSQFIHMDIGSVRYWTGN